MCDKTEDVKPVKHFQKMLSTSYFTVFYMQFKEMYFYVTSIVNFARVYLFGKVKQKKSLFKCEVSVRLSFT